MNRSEGIPMPDSQHASGSIMMSIDDLHCPEETTLKQLKGIQESGVNLAYGHSAVLKEGKSDIGSVAGWIGELRYLISSLSVDDKFSEWYHDCIGLVVVGIDRETGKNLSFMTHQNPKLPFAELSEFSRALNGKMTEVMARCHLESLDAVIFGWQDSDDTGLEEYEGSIRTLNSTISEKLGISSTVILGPSVESAYPTNAYFQTSKRRLTILRNEPTFDVTNESYPANRVSEYVSRVRKIVMDELGEL